MAAKSQKKVLLLGDIGVGKTSLVRRLVFDRFESNYLATVGFDIYQYSVPIAGGGASDKVDLVIWDTDGTYRENIFRTVVARGADAALIIGDVMRSDSQQSMAALADAFQQAFPGRPMAFALNKKDLLINGHVVALPARLSDPGLKLIRTSAKTGESVPDAFAYLAAEIRRRQA